MINLFWYVLKALRDSRWALIPMPKIILRGGIAFRICQSEENIVPEEKFIDLGKLCDLLIAPLNHNKQYGSLHDTGAIGDAIYLKKYIVIPKFFDPDGEFDDFCFYYENTEDITCLIKQQLSGCQQPSERVFKKFNSNLVLKKVCSDLGFKP